MSRVLVTGAGGFTGHYVVQALARAGHEVVRWSGDGSDTQAGRPVDIRDPAQVEDAVREARPDFVIHLAAIAFVAHGNVEEVYGVNLLGTRNLLDALARSATPPARVVLASSANVYGNAEGSIDENHALSPQNDYAVSKLAMEYMARLFNDRLPITLVRPFNYSGVGQSDKFLIPKIVSHFKARKPLIELGNIDVVRDFNDVRNLASAYATLLEGDRRWEVLNICSGQEYSLRQIVSTMEEIAGYRIEIRVNPDFVRANEVTRLVGDPARLAQRLGGLPAFSMRGLLEWMYQA